MKTSFGRRLTAMLVSLLMFCGMLPLSASAAEIAPIEQDNFTILWATDPQWYSFAYPEILTVQNEWVVNNANRMNILYTVHTGDFVDNPHSHDQWAVANKEYKKWDDAGMAYGVLAGNHDVDGTDHTEFSQYFGKARYENNWWYGGDYDDNFGHYDLINLGGVNFIFVYLGYGPHTDEDYAWMNSVLEEHSDYVAVLAFHEYLAATGERTSRGDTIFENVVLKNPNVRMVLCGHNYNSTRKVEDIDDNGDGLADRTVYQMMANYQSTTNGGNGFLRFMECDVEAGTITHRTYSPYTLAFGSDYEDGSVIDEFGKRDEFTIPFDFSAPVAKQEGDPESGTVVETASVAFAPTDSTQNLIFPVVGMNKTFADTELDGVAVFDRTFSLNAADAFAAPRAFNYVVTSYTNGVGHTVKKVIRGAWLDESLTVPIPHDGVVIAVPESAMDIGVLGIGHKVFTSRVNTHDLSKKPITLRVPSLDESYNIDGVNRVTGNGEWVIYDSLETMSYTHDWNMLFGFAPADGNTYSLVSANTALGEAKTMAIPDGGFVLSVNPHGCTAALASSLRAYFEAGLSVTLDGHTPGSIVNANTISLLPATVSGWVKETGAVAEQQGDAQVLYKTEGNWPALNYTFATPVTVDPATMQLCYDYMIETNGRGSMILTFKDSTPASYSSKESVTIQSAFDGATISSGSGDVKGDDVRRTGKVAMSDLAIPSTAYNDDGTLTVTGFRVMVSGTEAANMNKKIVFYSLGLSDTTDNADVAQSLPLMNDEITVVDPAKKGGYVYDNGVLTVTAGSADGYAVKLTLDQRVDIQTLKNLLVDVESTVPFDVRPIFTTAGDDASYGLASEFWPSLCDATVNDLIPAGSYRKALDVYSCFAWNNVIPADGMSTVKTVEVVLGGEGTLTLNALQVSNKTAFGCFADGAYKAESTPPTVLESDVYTVGDTFVDNVPAGTTVATLIANLQSAYPLTVRKDGAEADAVTLVATGMKVYAGEDVSRTLVVVGDVNADGRATTVDARTIVKAVLGAVSLDEAQTLAADFDGNDTMNTTDVRAILQSITG